jgi:polyisoprenoid-binding protein YceI
MVSRFSTLSLVCAAVFTGAVGRAANAADTFAVDPVHSAVVFRALHFGTSHAWGRFNDLSGTFALDESAPSQSVLDFTVKAASIDTGNPMRDQHLKSPDFFNAVQYPVISFKSKSVARTGDGYDVTGDLTLHGVTKSVKIKVTPVGAGKDPRGTSISGIDASFTIKQSEFGMTKMVGPIGDDVSVFVSIEGTKKR